MSGEGGGRRGAVPGPGPSCPPRSVREPEPSAGGAGSGGPAGCWPFRAAWRRPEGAWLPPPPWLVRLPEQARLGPGNKSEALGRRPGKAGHVPSPQPRGLWSLAASSVFPRGETWFSPGSSGAAGEGSRSLPASWWSWRPGARVQLSSGRLGLGFPPELVTLRKGRAVRSPAGGSTSQRPQPAS